MGPLSFVLHTSHLPLGALRTHLGTAHGGDKTANADETRLSNNLAGAVAIYILEKLKDYMVAEQHE